MKEIKESTPQPLDCPRCKSKKGYKVIYVIEKSFEQLYDAYGNRCGNAYNEYDKIIRQWKKTYCINCNTKLPFKIRK